MERGSEDAVRRSVEERAGAAEAPPGAPGEGDAEEADCGEAVERLYHYLDGELTEERRAKIQRHLDECHSCVEAYGFEAELRQLIANRCKDHVPPSLLERIRAALAEEEAKQATSPAE